MKLRGHSRSPKMLVGDFNGELTCFEEVMDMMRQEGWADEGREAGGTCQANNAMRMTRRDYCLACPLAHQYVSEVRISYTSVLAVHQNLRSGKRRECFAPLMGSLGCFFLN